MTALVCEHHVVVGTQRAELSLTLVFTVVLKRREEKTCPLNAHFLKRSPSLEESRYTCVCKCGEASPEENLKWIPHAFLFQAFIRVCVCVCEVLVSGQWEAE